MVEGIDGEISVEGAPEPIGSQTSVVLILESQQHVSSSKEAKRVIELN